jgi:hypothetical protein
MPFLPQGKTEKIVIHSNLNTNQFFFSTDHCQRFEGDRDWVPVSAYLPMYVVLRPCVPNGMVDTIEKFIAVFHDDETEIANPDIRYTPEFRIKKESDEAYRNRFVKCEGMNEYWKENVSELDDKNLDLIGELFRCPRKRWPFAPKKAEAKK